MAIIYGKNTAVDYAAGNLASFGKSYSRMGAAPLDMFEVWYDLAELQKYASFRGNDANGNPVYNAETEVVDTSAVTSYVGQKVAYVDDTNNKIYHYSIELDGSLKEIGTSPIGDEKSIVVAPDGTVSLKGVADLTFSREVDVVGEDGQPTGEKTTEDVTYQALMTKDGLVWVEPSKTTVEGLATLIDALTVRVKANEDAIGKASKPESSEGAGDAVAATGLHKKIEDEVARATAAENELDERIDDLVIVDDVKYDADTHMIQLFAGETAVGAGFDASDFIVDGMIESVELVANNEKEGEELVEGQFLKITWNTDAGKEVVYLNVTHLVDVYTAGNGLDLTDGEFSIQLDGESEEFLTVGTNGLKLSGVGSAIEAAETRAANDATNKANAVKAYVGEFTTGDDDYKDLDTVVAYINKKAEETLSAAQGGSSETAASVALALQNYKNENDPKVKANTDKLATIEEGAQVNKLESVVVDNGTGEGVPAAKLTASFNTENKTVTLNDAALQSAIAEAKKAGTDAASAASTAQSAAETAQNAAEVANGKAVKNAEDIKALQEADTTANGKITNLETAVNNETSGLAATYAKAAQNASDITALKAKDETHDKDVADLKASDLAQNGKITEIETALTNVYTKDQVNAITGTPTTGKTLVQMIEDSQKATQNAIDNLYKVPSGSGGENSEGEKPTGTLAEVIAGLEKSISDEVTRSTGIDDDHEERIAKMEVFWKAVDSTDEGDSNVINKLEEIVNYIESDKSGAADMVASVQANTEAIEKIYKETKSEETGEVTKSGVLIDLISEAVTDIPIATDTVLGLVMGSSAENKVSVATDGTMEVNSLNVNKLVQTEGEFLVLNGGGALVSTQ